MVYSGGVATTALRVSALGQYGYVASGEQGLQIFFVNCPRLSAELVGTQLLLQWPDYASDYRLECTGGLSPPSWQTVSGTPQLVNGSYQFSIPATSRAFFRLRRP